MRLEAARFNKVTTASRFYVNVVHRGDENVVKRLVLKVTIVPVEILISKYVTESNNMILTDLPLTVQTF